MKYTIPNKIENRHETIVVREFLWQLMVLLGLLAVAALYIQRL
jgi:hypothetical protein